MTSIPRIDLRRTRDGRKPFKTFIAYTDVVFSTYFRNIEICPPNIAMKVPPAQAVRDDTPQRSPKDEPTTSITSGYHYTRRHSILPTDFCRNASQPHQERGLSTRADRPNVGGCFGAFDKDIQWRSHDWLELKCAARDLQPDETPQHLMRGAPDRLPAKSTPSCQLLRVSHGHVSPSQTSRG